MSPARGVIGRACSAASVLLAILGLCMPGAVAYHTGSARSLGDRVSETANLPMNAWTGYTFMIGDRDTITYDIQVTSGTAIDMYIVLADGLVSYANDTAGFFNSWRTVENSTSIAGVYTGTRAISGATTVILDNVDFSGAQPTGSVTVTVSLVRTSGFSPLLIAGILVGIVLAIAVVALLLKMRKKPTPTTPAAPPPYVGPQPPYPPAPYPPPQPPQGPFRPPP